MLIAQYAEGQALDTGHSGNGFQIVGQAVELEPFHGDGARGHGHPVSRRPAARQVLTLRQHRL